MEIEYFISDGDEEWAPVRFQNQSSFIHIVLIIPSQVLVLLLQFLVFTIFPSTNEQTKLFHDDFIYLFAGLFSTQKSSFVLATNFPFCHCSFMRNGLKRVGAGL